MNPRTRVRLERERMRTRLPLSRMVTICLLAPAAFLLLGGCSDSDSVNPTRGGVGRVVRGDLTITVTESGQLQALEMEKIRSEVEGSTRILSIVPEGIQITEEDVKAGKVLVQLDSSSLAEKLTQQEITFAAAEAGFTQAKEAYEIQVNQNESNVKAGELKVKFGLIDLQRYLGAGLAARLDPGKIDVIDVAGLIGSAELAGAGRQEKRKLESEIDLADEEVKRAKDKLDSTETLFKAEYVSQEERDADALAHKRRVVDVEQKREALQLFLQYEFPKEVLQLFSDLTESKRELERIKARARSEIANADAQRQSKRATYRLQKERLEKLQEQVKKCTIRATRTGLVVYASRRDWRGNVRNEIAEGVDVRQRQEIIYLPDLSSMTCEVKVHESAIKKVRAGQRCKVTVDAMPDIALDGEVKKVSVLPASTSWYNADIRVFDVVISIKGKHDGLKPGMSARADIIVAELADVLYVPVQAVFVRRGHRLCYVFDDGEIKVRPVQTGQSNDKYVIIRSGLNEDEKVLLYEPTPLPELPPELEKPVGGKPERERSGPSGDEPAPEASSPGPSGGPGESGQRQPGGRAPGERPSSERRSGGPPSGAAPDRSVERSRGRPRADR